MSTWEEFRTFWKKQKKDDDLSRGQLHSCLGVKAPSNRMSTIDSYRAMLERAGYIQTTCRGFYARIKPIPKYLSIKECKEKAYPSNRKVRYE